jgi:hypothetical protein
MATVETTNCELLLSEHASDDRCSNPEHQKALERRRAGAPAWSSIVRGKDAGGDRDFLDGEPISCGSALELQSMEYRADDYGEFTVKLAGGTPVRYELAAPARNESRRQIVLYASVGGHEFATSHEAWMRFRWPRRD